MPEVKLLNDQVDSTVDKGDYDFVQSADFDREDLAWYITLASFSDT